MDAVLWSCLDNTQIQAGIIAHTLQDAQDIFTDKLKFTFEHLDPRIRILFQTVGDSSRELAFKHGSVIRVGTSLRSATLQYLHISEYGKICAKYPEKAREVQTGALNTVQAGQTIIIESTAEGKEGHFFALCDQAFANEKNGKKLSAMDYKPFFFPWWKHTQEYSIDDLKIDISDSLVNYFDKLANLGIALTDGQKNWYAKKYETQAEDMLREYPSTPEEAFQASQVGNWYATQLKELHSSGHLTTITYDRSIPVHTAWDLGQRDPCAIWFFQINRAGEIMVIDFFQSSDTQLNQIAQMLKDKGYTYGEHLWPHDANARDRAGITFVQQAAEFGLRGIVLEQHSLIDGINLVRLLLSKCWFDEKRCREGIIALENYQKKWNTQIGGYSSDPLENKYCHAADSFRYLAAGYKNILSQPVSAEKDYEAARKFWGG